jgi:hypothetical protein
MYCLKNLHIHSFMTLKPLIALHMILRAKDSIMSLTMGSIIKITIS